MEHCNSKQICPASTRGERTWLNTGVAVEIFPESKDEFKGMFLKIEKYLFKYAAVSESNLVIVYIDSDEGNAWIYCFKDPERKHLNEGFFNKYVGTVLEKSQTIKILEKCYDW